MDLDALRVFLAVADTGSLLAAAERLGLPRSTLRRRLDDLEAEAGVPLLHRTAQGATLTPAGETVAAGGRRILHETTALLASARDVSPEPFGTLRVALPAGLPPHALVAISLQLRATYPQLGLDARIYDDPAVGLASEFDIAFLIGHAVPNGPWVTRVLLRVPERLVATPDYLARHGRPRTIADLADHDLYVWRPPNADPRRLPLLDGTTAPIAPVGVASDIHTIRQVALAGACIAFVPDGQLPDPFAPPDALEPVLPELVGRDCAFRVVVPEALARSPKIRAVQEGILAFLNE